MLVFGLSSSPVLPRVRALLDYVWTTEPVSPFRTCCRAAILSIPRSPFAVARANSQTGGQVSGGGNFSVGQGFVLRVRRRCAGQWRGSVVEGRGVSPDVDVPLSSEELRQGNDNQLTAALDAAQAL